MKSTVILCATLLGLLVAACGVPADSSPQLLDESALPDELTSPSTTTTTTEAPSSSVDQAIFFLDDEDFLAEVSREVPRPVDALEVLTVLMMGPTEDESAVDSLRTAIPLETEVLSTEQSGEILTIALAAGFLEEIGSALQKEAIAQIVYTATAIEGISGVLIEIDGVLRQLPTDEGDSQSEEPVTRDDYRSLDPVLASTLEEGDN